MGKEPLVSLLLNSLTVYDIRDPNQQGGQLIKKKTKVVNFTKLNQSTC